MAANATETSSIREQLRTFHIAGCGLEDAVPAAPLRPAALDQLQQLPPFEPDDLLSLYTAAATSARGPARAAFLAKLRQAREALTELLALDAGSNGPAASPGNITAALGNESSFFDAGALAHALHASSNGRRGMDPERRARIEGTLAVLDEALAKGASDPPVRTFDDARAALDFCDRQLTEFAAVLRALKIARLEREAAFDPQAFHDALARFDWQSADAEDLLALPPVVVLETAARLAQSSLTAFGRLLRSGRPIQILVTTSGLYSDDLSGSMPDFGYLSIAHREAFVLQSLTARPEHLTAGLAEMARKLRPAVAIVSIPSAPDHEARLAASLLYLSHAFPLFRYDPDRGATWSERFDLLVDEDLPVTLADSAAVSREFLGHFRIVPQWAWDDEQMEFTEYLKRYTAEPPLAIPFLWVTDTDGTPRRAALTRELVNLCRDRGRAWRIFEELAGVKNAYVEAAVAKADREGESKAKLDGATEAIHRVVAILQGQAISSTIPAPVQPAPQAVATAIGATPSAPAPAAPASEAPVGPHIDSFLCTSCNDCFKINSRLFAYDGNKQAYIADAGAGTFAELVKAAEGCPARCIHPGTARPGDPTASPQVIARAAKLG